MTMYEIGCLTNHKDYAKDGKEFSRPLLCKKRLSHTEMDGRTGGLLAIVIIETALGFDQNVPLLIMTVH